MSWGSIAAEHVPRHPQHNGGRPGDISNKVSHGKRESGSIARPPPGLDARAGSLDEEHETDREGGEKPKLPCRTCDCQQSGHGARRQRDQHGWRVQDHRRSRHIVASDTSWMTHDHIEPPVPNAKLLTKISA
jgi:hypothetical protein